MAEPSTFSERIRNYLLPSNTSSKTLPPPVGIGTEPHPNTAVRPQQPSSSAIAVYGTAPDLPVNPTQPPPPAQALAKSGPAVQHPTSPGHPPEYPPRPRSFPRPPSVYTPLDDIPDLDEFLFTDTASWTSSLLENYIRLRL